LDIVRAEPLAVPVGGLVGGLLGAALGWFAARWGVRRWRASAGLPRRVASGLAIAGGLGLLPATGLTLVREAVGYAQLSRPQVPLWTGLTEPALRSLAVLGAVVVLAALATVASARPAEQAA
jgi:hypothetical protein